MPYVVMISYNMGVCLSFLWLVYVYTKKEIIFLGSKPVAADNLVTHILPEVIK